MEIPVYHVPWCAVGTQPLPVQESQLQRLREGMQSAWGHTAQQYTDHTGQPDVELGSTSKDMGGALASCLLARGWTWSGPQANETVWERSLLESQVAELPATKPFWRTERAHEGGVQDMPGSLQLGLQVTPLQGRRQLSLQHTQAATARRQSQMQLAPQNGCSLNLCSWGLSPPPFHISHPGPQDLNPNLGGAGLVGPHPNSCFISA